MPKPAATAILCLRRRLLVCAALSGCLLSALVSAQPTPADGGDSKRIEIRRAAEAPVIDGRLDDAAWADATLLDDLHQVTPIEYATPTERTEVYLLYTADTLYVAARMFDREPELINARVLRQNQPIGPDDRFFLHIDPFANRRSGYLFGVNPNGIRFDGVFQNISDRQFDWDGIWHAESAIDADGWTVEIAIPFKTLSFDPSRDAWRMNFVRYIIRRNEQMAWASRNRNTDPTTMGTVGGLVGLEQGVGLDVVPSLTMRERRAIGGRAGASTSEPSLDVFYKITPGLNAALTVNTDFSATEVDNRQVNLTRFNLFFPERRDFFLQDLDIFQFASLGRLNTGNDSLENTATTRPARENARPFFSRSLGIGPNGEEVPLDYGGKLSGRVGRFDLGALAIRQEASATVPETDAFVGRVVANVLAESSIGLIATSGNPTADLDNSLVGADFRYLNGRLPGGRRLEVDGWYQRSDTEGLEGEDSAAGAGFRMPNNTGVRGGVGFKRVERNFNPALGFISRTGVADRTLEVGHTWRRAGQVQTLFTGLDAQRIDYLDDDSVQSEVLSLRALEVETRSRDQLRVRRIESREGLRVPFQIAPGVIVPAGEHSFGEYELRIASGNQRKVSGNFGYRAGEFLTGERLNLTGSIGWRPSAHFRASFEYDYNDVVLPEGEFVVRLTRVQLETAFNSRWSWVNLVQYDNLSETVGINSRLHWIPQAGRQMFLVLNHNVDDPDRDNSFKSSFSELALKLNYTFRF